CHDDNMCPLKLDNIPTAVDVHVSLHDALPIYLEQARDEREQRRLARAVRPDDRRESARGQREPHAVDDPDRAVGLHRVQDVDHRFSPRTSRARNTMPPRNSMMTASAVSNANTRSRTVWPATSASTPSRAAAGMTTACRWEPAMRYARFATSRPKNMIGPTRAVDTETSTATTTSTSPTVRR